MDQRKSVWKNLCLLQLKHSEIYPLMGSTMAKVCSFFLLIKMVCLDFDESQQTKTSSSTTMGGVDILTKSGVSSYRELKKSKFSSHYLNLFCQFHLKISQNLRLNGSRPNHSIGKLSQLFRIVTTCVVTTKLSQLFRDPKIFFRTNVHL